MPEALMIQDASPTVPSAALGNLAVGICTYNRGSKILRTLEALRRSKQCSSRFTSCVVIDNNCTDDTAAVVDSFIAAHPGEGFARVPEPRQGASEARRRVFHSTSEPLVCLMDDDCIPAPNWAEKLLHVFDAHPKAGAVGPRIDMVWESGPTRFAREYKEFLACQDFGTSRTVLSNPESGIVTAAMALRRRAIVECGWLSGARLGGRTPGSLSSGEDTEICIRLRRAGWEVWYEPASMVGHLIPAERQTLNYLARLRHAISLTEPLLKWMAHGEPGMDWVQRCRRRAFRQYWRTRLFEWRWPRRRMRLAERAGRLKGWDELLAKSGPLNP